jgi:hypothetical protein
MQIFGPDSFPQASPGLSGAGSWRDGGWRCGSTSPCPTPDAAAEDDPITCSGRNPVGHTLPPHLTPASTPALTPKAQELDKPRPPLSPSPAALVKGAARRHRGKVRQGSSESKLPSLACPFYKLDRRSHQDCRGFTLRRVKDIKQHIQRKHVPEPGFHCDLCLGVSDAEKHRKSALSQLDPHHACACPLRSGRRPWVITSEQTEKLKGYHGRGKPTCDQWYDMWDILFPSERRPRTIYLDSTSNSREGHMKMLRRVWETHRSEILAAVVCSPPPLSIPGGLHLAGLGGSLDPWWPSTRMVTPPAAMSESFAQRRPFDQVMDAFLALVQEEMADDVLDVDGPDPPHSTAAESTCLLQGTQQPWYSSPNVYCPGDPDSILWPTSADPGIESPGLDIAAPGTLTVASVGVTCNFSNDLGSPWSWHDPGHGIGPRLPGAAAGRHVWTR